MTTMLALTLIPFAVIGGLMIIAELFGKSKTR